MSDMSQDRAIPVDTGGHLPFDTEGHVLRSQTDETPEPDNEDTEGHFAAFRNTDDTTAPDSDTDDTEGHFAALRNTDDTTAPDTEGYHTPF